tara:strand:+ start:98 stop:301 length:204 start_codon:yes stop_codon:yes gene_type:complete
MLIKLSTLVLFFLVMAWIPLNAAELKVGDVAPGFSLPGSDGKTYTLKEFKNKSVVVVAWYPKAFTGG